MSLFYAYLKDTEYDHYYRYLITFVNREVADEWWRTISIPPSPFAGKINRISPQFYTQSADKVINIADKLFTTDLEGRQFFGKLFFTLLNDRDGRILSIIPPLEITDHISGKWYFIRSKFDSHKFWYFRVSGKCLVCGNGDCDSVHVSTEHRSRFRIQVQNLPCQNFSPKDLVMIGSDEVSIAASKDHTLVDDAGELRVTKAYQIVTPNLLFLFGDLKDRFATRVEQGGIGGLTWENVVLVERGLGEPWEIVN